MALVAVLAGCAPVSGAGGAPGAPTVDADGFPSDVPIELKVREPKDARGIGPCELLTVAQQEELGLDPSTAKSGAEGLAQSCFWYYRGQHNYARIGISTDSTAGKLPALWRLFRDDPNYEQFEVAGHPALRTNVEPDRFCDITVAIADLQTVVVAATADLTPRPDPCAPSRRMAELILSNLPPLIRESR
ncbi:DUF3558 domain-containing protein [Pseudonocardia sp.]|uniref:DUF3558 domain-containing protein n=1 Tax=Pseudonocardia sp. TaxID=60912 RepID=UPI003D12224D